MVTIGFLNFSSQRQLAKDTVRAQDLKTISNLLDLSFGKGHDFPKPNVTTMSGGVLYQETIDGKQFETGTFGGDAIIAQFGEEASKIPLDPNDKTEYYYSLSKDKRFYILRAKLDSGGYYAIANYMTSLPSDILAKNTTTGTELPKLTPPTNGGTPGNGGGGGSSGTNPGGGGGATPGGGGANGPGEGGGGGEETPEPQDPEIPKPTNYTPEHHFTRTPLPDGTGVIITGYNGPSSVVIPEELDGKPVKKIANSVFLGKNITHLESHSVVEIGSNAFKNNNSLATVVLPKVKIIGNEAFQANGSLLKISLPRVEEIGDRAFYGNSKLATVELPRVKNIGSSAFESGNIQSLQIGSTNRAADKIGTKAFYNNKIENLEIRVKEIGDEAFYNNRLKIVSLPVTITIKRRAFVGYGYGHGNIIASLTAPLLQHVGEGAFYYNLLTIVNLPSLKTAGPYSFVCNNLTTVILPSIETIGQGAFVGSFSNPENYPTGNHYYNSNLYSTYSSSHYPNERRKNYISALTMNKEVREIGKYAFSVNDIRNIDINPIRVGEFAFYSNQNHNSSLDFKRIETIGRAAFQYNSIERIKLGNTLQSIGNGAFHNNSGIQREYNGGLNINHAFN
ncbi:hypothetical protein DLH72_01505 [Candidatus Gracilibacteria bacterium]|nr:MAG: hypothetical protein DLH72_01505 [Candidatus Gracilibacteria bacterium]